MVATDLEHHEGKFTAGRQHDPQTNRADLVQTTGQVTDDKQQRQLDCNQQQGQAQHRDRCTQQQVQVGAHADADEKQPQQQALEGFDLRFQFVTVFGVRQQQTGEKGPKRHGNTGQLHEPRGADHHQQRRGGEHFRQRGFAHHAKDRAQQITSADHHYRDAGQHLQAVVQVFGGTGAVTAPGEQRHHGDQRDRGDVLEQQDGKRQPPVGAGQLLALGQALQAEGGGRQRQPQAEHDGTVERLAKGVVRQHPDH
ncbi:hypothetical protein D3C81_1346460 [compost metagenome]